MQRQTAYQFVAALEGCCEMSYFGLFHPVLSLSVALKPFKNVTVLECFATEPLLIFQEVDVIHCRS